MGKGSSALLRLSVIVVFSEVLRPGRFSASQRQSLHVLLLCPFASLLLFPLHSRLSSFYVHSRSFDSHPSKEEGYELLTLFLFWLSFALLRRRGLISNPRLSEASKGNLFSSFPFLF